MPRGARVGARNFLDVLSATVSSPPVDRRAGDGAAHRGNRRRRRHRAGPRRSVRPQGGDRKRDRLARRHPCACLRPTALSRPGGPELPQGARSTGAARPHAGPALGGADGTLQRFRGDGWSHPRADPRRHGRIQPRYRRGHHLEHGARLACRHRRCRAALDLRQDHQSN